MIEFFICDDDKKMTEKISNLVNKLMFNRNEKYKIVTYHDYNDKFFSNVSKSIGQRIYILDIEMPSCSGIDAARYIRKTDLCSQLIFLTGHEELGPLVLRKDLFFLAFISKFDDAEKRLIENIEKAFVLFDKKNYLHFCDGGTKFNISFDDILYISRDSAERKLVIYTSKSSYKVNKTLKEIKTLLNDYFIYTHRACIVNKNRSASINFKNKEIRFDNGVSIDLVSPNYRKEIEKYDI